MPVPSAVISVPISWLPSILSKRARSTLRILPRSGSTAWKARSRACLALPPAESPSTRNSSDLAGSRSWQSASLPGSEGMSSAPLRRGGVARVPRRLTRRGGLDDLLHDDAGFARVFLEPLRECIGHYSLDHWPYLGG